MYLVSLVAWLSLARPSASCSTVSSAVSLAWRLARPGGGHEAAISRRLRSCTPSTQSSHRVSVVCTPGVSGNPRSRSMRASSVTTRACSRSESITSLSTRLGCGGSRGMGRLLELEIFLPGFCRASEASVFFLSFSRQRNWS